MEYLIYAFGVLSGIALVKRGEIRGYFKSKYLVRTLPKSDVPVSRILKPFAQHAKRKPRVNDDERAYLAEQNRSR